MDCRLVKLENISGDEASIYSILMEDDNTLFDRFIIENKSLFKSEILNLYQRLITIGHKTGVRDQYFRKNEGAVGDEIWAFYDIPNSKLRLYIIYFNKQLIIVGGGGPKNVRALQEDDKLKSENYFLRGLSRAINQRIRDQEVRYINEGLDFEGDLEFDNIEETK